MKIIIMILFFFCIATPGSGQSKETYQKISDSLLSRGKNDELIKYFERELRKYPRNEDVLRWLGYGYIVKGNAELGEKYYLNALEVNPVCARCYLNIGRTYSLRNDNKKALDYFDKAISIDPKDALLYSNRGILYEALGDKFSALRDHDKAIELDPSKYEYFTERGLYNANSGYQSLAISDFSKAIELAPDNYNPYFHRSSIYYNQRKFDLAFNDITKAISLDSTKSELYTGRGAIYDVTQQYQMAVKDYSRSISLNSLNYLSYLNRANSYYKLENLDASCADYTFLKSAIDKNQITEQDIINEVIEATIDFCDSTKPSYYYQRGIGYYNLKEFTKALDVYTKGLTRFPENAMMLSFKGNAYLAVNNYKEAIEYYELSLKNKESVLSEIRVNPRFSNAPEESVQKFYDGHLAATHSNIAECMANLGLFDEGLTEINIALDLIPDLPDFNKETYYNLRGYIYLLSGKYEPAIRDFTASIQVNPDFPLPYVNRAIAKVSGSDRIKISTFNVQGNFENQPMQISWSAPTKSSLKKSESSIFSALTDCNMAIDLDEKFGYAYYIRGQIKQMLMYGDYCIDLLMAQKSGITIEEELLKHCGKK